MNFVYDGLIYFSPYINFLITILSKRSPDLLSTPADKLQMPRYFHHSNCVTTQKCLWRNIQKCVFVLACIRAAVQCLPQCHGMSALFLSFTSLCFLSQAQIPHPHALASSCAPRGAQSAKVLFCYLFIYFKISRQ